MNNEWIHWIVTQLRKNEAPLLLVNYRPITLRNIIYNIWAGGLGGRRTPILNLLTDEAQTEYKTDQCVPDYLSFIGNEVGNARQTYMCVLISRKSAIWMGGILWVILYGKWAPGDTQEGYNKDAMGRI